MSASSLFFQTFLYFDANYSFVYIPLQLFLFVYKYNSLVYSATTMALEVIFLFVVLLLNWVRITLGRAGNRGRSTGKLVGYLLLSLVVIFGFVYVIAFQSAIFYL